MFTPNLEPLQPCLSKVCCGVLHEESTGGKSSENRTCSWLPSKAVMMLFSAHRPTASGRPANLSCPLRPRAAHCFSTPPAVICPPLRTRRLLEHRLPCRYPKHLTLNLTPITISAARESEWTCPAWPLLALRTRQATFCKVSCASDDNILQGVSIREPEPRTCH